MAGVVLAIATAAAWTRFQDSDDTVASVAAEPGTQVGVHYFTWYRRTEGAPWSNGLTPVHAASPRPALGEYNSNDKEVMDLHISQMEQAGIDFAILNVIVNSPPSWGNVDRFMERVRGRRLKFAVMIDGLHDAPPAAEADAVVRAGAYTSHSSYLRVDGEPLVLLFSAKVDFAAPGAVLRNVYWTPDYRDGSNTFNGGPLLAADWPFWSPSPQARINGMVPVIPCYSDGHLKRPVAMEHPRDDGRTYHEQWQRALSLRPPFIVIYGWNEYFEQTMIEPTDAWGESYLQWTACYTALAHAGQQGTC